MRDVVIVGGGVNGLVAAAYLAKGGLKPLVLERADRVGGCAMTTELAPGFHCPTLAHAASLDTAVVSDLALERHGLHVVRPDAYVVAPTPEGRALVLWADTARAAFDIGEFSERDAARYPSFVDTFSKLSGVLRRACSAPPPSIDAPTAADLLALFKTARSFRALGRADAYRLLRWMPMSVADLVGEWFESEPLRASIAAGGVFGSFLGPRSAGSAAVLLMLGARHQHPVHTGWTARGGIGAVADAVAAAAREAGADIRTGADVGEITVTDGLAKGVVLASGETIAARTVVSALDPRRTFLRLVDPAHLPPEFVHRARHIRMHGALAKVNFAVSELPHFSALSNFDGNQQTTALAGKVRLSPNVDAIERAFDAAKYGGFSQSPWIELTIPSLADPDLAPARRHVVSAYVQYAPYQLRGSDWNGERDRLGDITATLIGRYAPGFERSVVAREVITPLDLEQRFGLTGGHIFHGELALDQLFVSRPLLGWARYATPIGRLHLCGSGTHPGTGLDGRSGAVAAAQILRDLRE